MDIQKDPNTQQNEFLYENFTKCDKPELITNINRESFDGHVIDDSDDEFVETEQNEFLYENFTKYDKPELITNINRESFDGHVIDDSDDEFVERKPILSHSKGIKSELVTEEDSLANFNIKDEEINIKSEEQDDCRLEWTSKQINVYQKSDSERAAINTNSPLNICHKPSEISETFNCNYCYYKTNNKYYLKQHLVRHTNSLSDQIKCPRCDYVTVDRSNFNRHILKHDKKPQKTFICYSCGHETNRKYTLQIHITRHHQTNSDQTVRRHVVKKNTEFVECNKCDFRTRYKVDLLIHQVKHETKKKQNKLHVCELCAYATPYKTNIVRHKATHTSKDSIIPNIKLYKCDEDDCSFETYKQSSFKNHLLIHKPTEDLVFHKCNKCNYRTLYKTNLYRHLQRHKNLSEIKRFYCYECRHCTTRKDELKNHIFLRHRKSNIQ